MSRNRSSVTGSDVTFYITEDSGSGDSINIQAGASVTLSADTGGDLPGVLFFQDRNGPTNVTHSMTGGSNMELDGIIYQETPLPNDASYGFGFLDHGVYSLWE